jgi:hypothetical protein
MNQFPIRPFRIFSKICGDIRSKFTASVVDTCGNLTPVSLTQAANLPPASTTLAIPVANLLPLLLIPMVHLYWRILYLREFSKKFEMSIMLFSWAWGKMIHEKIMKQKVS